jgi:MFS family permease
VAPASIRIAGTSAVASRSRQQMNFAAHPGLTPAARRRGLIVLLIATFLTWGGFFVVVPLIAVHYVDGLGWAASSVGLVLAVRQFTQQGSTTLSGALADRLGAKGLICAGMFVRAIGFAIMVKADTFAILMLSAIVAALGGGLFESPKAAAIATLTDESNRRRFYSLAGVVAGLGVAIGTQVGALLIKADFAAVSLVGAVTFLATFLLVLTFLPPIQVATESHGLFQGFALASRDRVFVAYVCLLMGYWFMSTQFNLSLTLRAASVSGTDSAVAWVYGINSAATPSPVSSSGVSPPSRCSSSASSSPPPAWVSSAPPRPSRPCSSASSSSPSARSSFALASKPSPPTWPPPPPAAPTSASPPSASPSAAVSATTPAVSSTTTANAPIFQLCPG